MNKTAETDFQCLNNVYLQRMLTKQMKKPYKKWMLAALVLLLAAGAATWWIFTEKFDDTKTVKPDYTVNATAFLKEFQQDIKKANEKYSEKIIVVNGTVSSVEPSADTTANIKMTDTLTGAYIIFAFQHQHLAEAKALKEGDKVSIKGSCSAGVHSDILDTDYISFKRCTITK